MVLDPCSHDATASADKLTSAKETILYLLFKHREKKITNLGTQNLALEKPSQCSTVYLPETLALHQELPCKTITFLLLSLFATEVCFCHIQFLTNIPCSEQYSGL